MKFHNLGSGKSNGIMTLVNSGSCWLRDIMGGISSRQPLMSWCYCPSGSLALGLQGQWHDGFSWGGWIRFKSKKCGHLFFSLVVNRLKVTVGQNKLWLLLLYATTTATTTTTMITTTTMTTTTTTTTTTAKATTLRKQNWSHWLFYEPHLFLRRVSIFCFFLLLLRNLTFLWILGMKD